MTKKARKKIEYGLAFTREVTKLNGGHGIELLDQVLSHANGDKKFAGTESKENSNNCRASFETSFKDAIHQVLNGDENEKINYPAEEENDEKKLVIQDIKFFGSIFGQEGLDELEQVEMLQKLDKNISQLDMELEELDFEMLEDILDVLGLDKSLENVNSVVENLMQMEDILDLNVEKLLLNDDLDDEELDILNEDFELGLNSEINSEINNEKIYKMLDTLNLEQDAQGLQEMFEKFTMLQEDTDKMKELFDALEMEYNLENFKNLTEEISQLEEELDLHFHDSFSRIISALKAGEKSEAIDEELENLVQNDEEGLKFLVALILMHDYSELEESGEIKDSRKSSTVKTIDIEFILERLSKAREDDGELDSQELSRELDNLRRLMAKGTKQDNSQETGTEDIKDINSALDFKVLTQVRELLDKRINSLQENAEAKVEISGARSEKNELKLLSNLLNSDEDSESQGKKLLNRLLGSLSGEGSKNHSSQNRNSFTQYFNSQYDSEGNQVRTPQQNNFTEKMSSENMLQERNLAANSRFSNNFNNLVSSTNRTQDTSTLNLEDIFDRDELRMFRESFNEKAATNQANRSSSLYNRQAFVERLSQEIMKFANLNRSKDTFTLNLRLEPEQLGRLKLEFSSQDGVLRGEIVAQNQQARQIIQSNLSQLKEELEAQGYEFESLEVSSEEDTGAGYEQGEGARESEIDDKRAVKGKPQNEEDLELLNQDDLEIENENSYLEEGYSKLDYLV